MTKQTKKIDESLVKSLLPPPRGNRIIYDTDLPGFGIRITANGVKAFVLNYTFKSSERRFTIGRWPVFTANAARKHALELKKQIMLGNDPQGERAAERLAPTVATLFADYKRIHLPVTRLWDSQKTRNRRVSSFSRPNRFVLF